ncbi:Retrovirus-related Pol polyprotein from transposon TNT 1-94 [Podosphaera aphanis]|nr:Retrovirus-related Pol polyprotein from transposon TNT 1-94 [Podosphaera aphanis]
MVCLNSPIISSKLGHEQDRDSQIPSPTVPSESQELLPQSDIEPEPESDSSSLSLPPSNAATNSHNFAISSRPKRTIRARTFEDTITGEWWKTSRDLPLPDSHNSNTNNVQELAMVNIHDESEPRSYGSAKASPNWDHWNVAFEEEMSSLKENDVWDVVPRPTGRKVVGGKWVCKLKRNAQGEVERYKARYVAKGFSQIHGLDYDETFAPVVRFDSLRLLLAISASKKWKPRQLDIKTAFLYGILKEEIYLELPEGYRKENHVARLKRCIYGLKQSPREWYFRLTEYLSICGFAPTLFDPCVFTHNTGKLIIAVYVDDIVLFGEQGSLMDKIVNGLKTEFKVNDLGILHWLLGIQIEYHNASITLSQTAYIDRILNRFSMHDCNPVSLPIDCNHRLMSAIDGEPRANATLYQQIIGSIIYLVSATRPDLAYTISHLSQFNSDPSITHLGVSKRVLRYLKGTRDLKLTYKFESPLVLNGYCDASYGNCLDTRRSFAGYLFQLGESTICWKSRKQRTVALSTCESEYMALALAAKQFIWVVDVLHRLIDKDIPATLSSDNTAAIHLAHNPKINDATKHIDMAYHFVRELIEDGLLTLHHIPTDENLADICTKGLPKPKLNHLCTSIFGTK